MNVNNFNIIRQKYTIFIFSIYLGHLFLMSCSSNTKNDKIAVVSDSIPNISSSLKNENKTDNKLEYFVGFPDVFKNDGGGMFTYDSVKLEHKKYIFLSNLSGVAAIKINGHEIYLKADSSQFTYRKDNFYQEVWIGNGLQIVLKLNVNKDLEEGACVDGILELTTKNTKRKIKIHGYTEV